MTKTALGVAVMRAHESRRDDRLFDDPYAQAFADAMPGAFAAEEATAAHAGQEPLRSLGAAFNAAAVIRTRFFDDFLLAASTACHQVVLLGAGLDTRAFRLRWPRKPRVFEVDLPGLFSFKEAVLAECGAVASCERIIVAADLRSDLRSGWRARLAAAGFDRTVPSAWLAEGLLTYLTADAAARLLNGVGELSVPGSRIALEHGAQAGGSLLSQARGLPSMRRYASLWKGGLGEDAGGWLSRHGWRTQRHDAGAVASRYRRAAPGTYGGGFITAVRMP